MDRPDAGSSKTGETSEEHSEPSGMPGVGKKRSISQMEDTDVTQSSSDGSDREDMEDVETPQPTASCQIRRTNMLLQGCRDMDEFKFLNKISEGSYGVVYRARDKRTGEVVALKKLNAMIENGGFPMTSLREINILSSLRHPSVVDVKGVVVDASSSPNSVFLVMEHMAYELKGFMEGMIKPYSPSEVKRLMRQLLEGVSYLHDNWIIHRDLKTSNLLLDNRGNLKICDFGLSRRFGSHTKRYSPTVVTLRYRAPELLLGATQYSTAIDMWSVGCIMAELLVKEPLFNGTTDLEMLSKMFGILGTPDETTWPGLKNLPGARLVSPKQPLNYLKEKFPPTSIFGGATLSETGIDLLSRLLTYDPDKRITAKEALSHPWFREPPLPQVRGFPADLVGWL